MFKIGKEQHAAILRWAIVGYGVSFIYAALLPLMQLASLPGTAANSGSFGSLLWPTILGNIIVAIVCFIAANGIGYAKASPKNEGLVFAVVSPGFFPLG